VAVISGCNVSDIHGTFSGTIVISITSIYDMNSGICIAYMVHVAVASLLYHITCMYSTVKGTTVT
jgi:hypothetical protein